MKTPVHPLLLASFALGLLLTGGMMFYAFQHLVGAQKHTFEKTSLGITQNMVSNIESAQDVLRGLTLSLYAENAIDNNALSTNMKYNFVHYPFIKTALFAMKVEGDERVAFEHGQQEAGFIDYTLHNEQYGEFVVSSERARYFPVYQVEPFDVEHVSLLGLDVMGIELLSPLLQETIETAGDISVIMPLRDGKSNLWLFKALYSGYLGLGDPSFKMNRNHMVNGFVGVEVDLTAMLANISAPKDVSVSIDVRGALVKDRPVLRLGDDSLPRWWSGFVLADTFVYPIQDQYIDVRTRKIIHWFDRGFVLFFLSGALGLGLTIMLMISLRELVRSEGRKHNILDAAFEGIISVDYMGKVVGMNPAAEDIFGQTVGQCMGKSIDTLIEMPAWAEREPFEHFINIHPEFVQEIQEMEACAELGESIILEVSLSQVKVNSHQSEFHLFLRDVTAKRHLQEQSEHAQRLESLGVLAGGIAHDFNNLLTAIMGHTSMALKKEEATPDLQTHLTHVMKASESAASLCKQMLAYSGKGAFVVRYLDLSEIISGISKLLASTVSKSIVINIDLAKDLPKIKVDEAQVQQVAMNLIINASEAIGEETGAIEVSTRLLSLSHEEISLLLEGEELSEGEYVQLRVSDTGCGMDEITMKKVFDPFFTTKFTGRGLGMSAILGIVRGHGGGLRLHSSVGQGTTFEVFFPAAKAE